jgi:DNA-binding transcriptional regulator YiaG
VDALAALLHVTVEALEGWLDGDTVPTNEVYMKALDLVASPTRLKPG